MSKSHRDNARARKKIGKVAYKKKAARRKTKPRCNLCRTFCRESKLITGLCQTCRDTEESK